jgi:hypothetical protein
MISPDPTPRHPSHTLRILAVLASHLTLTITSAIILSTAVEAQISACAAHPDAECRALTCPMRSLQSAPFNLSFFLDIDTDDDGEFDALSIGLLWEATPATVIGFAP